MRILIVYRHFWPDSPPYASMLRTLGRCLAEDGHNVTIWAEQPCYKSADRKTRAPRHERLDGIVVERMSPVPGAGRFGFLQVIDKVIFPLRTVAKALWHRLKGEPYDLVWTATIPPIAAGLAGRIIANLFGARFLYHCQDLYPEIAGHTGLWRRGGLTYRVAETIERHTRQRADLLVTLSGDMANTVREMAEPRSLAVINNFMLEDFSRPAGTDRSSFPPIAVPARNDGKIQIIFAGNLGQFQGLEAVVDAMRLIEREHPTLQLVLMGDGKALPSLRERAEGLSNVRFEPHRPFEEAQLLIASADIGLVSLEPGIQRYAFPSKTLTYLGLGLPIFAIIDLESELAEMVRGGALGWVSAGRDKDEIARTLLLIPRSIESLPYPRFNSSQFPGRVETLRCWSQALVLEALGA